MGAVNTTVALSYEDIAWFRDGASLAAASRGAAATLARRIGLSSHRVAEVALAVTEAATNVQRHADDGALLLRVVRSGDQAGVEFLTVDSGPGITDVPAALADGSSSAGTLGIGLGAVARLADQFDLHSVPGRGTVMAAQFWPRAADGSAVVASRDLSTVAGVTRPISGETACGDAWAVRTDDRGAAGDRPAILVMLCDGLGHGPLAARASQAAVKAFQETRDLSPAGALDAIHLALRGTRGGAVAVARIEPAAGRVLYCGIGNVSGFLLGDDGRKALLSAPGIVGAQMRRLRTFEQALPAHGALVMHSDGLTERWDHGTLPGLMSHTPLVMAGQLLREAGVRRDDASVVVIKGAW
ncbi:ATP-binding SpoIIE family protein phosphatase [Streptomyces sp. NPDC057620]|uniref:ATP-binding SpoIIE family protein phosphatase n=1 Tax=Streptomyces sp. NPDC057620 TaxID=3346185 RepID=UPI00368A7383